LDYSWAEGVHIALNQHSKQARDVNAAKEAQDLGRWLKQPKTIWYYNADDWCLVIDVVRSTLCPNTDSCCIFIQTM
jgi:hypothetical protein